MKRSKERLANQGTGGEYRLVEENTNRVEYLYLLSNEYLYYMPESKGIIVKVYKEKGTIFGRCGIKLVELLG